MSDLTQLKRIIEGALLAAGEPLSLERLSQLFLDEQRPSNAELRAALQEIASDFSGRGFELKEVANGWRFQVCDDLSDWISRLWEEKPARYSRALLETLALIAYRQPVTRGEIEEVRGVSVSSNIIRTLLEREWVRVVGHRDVPGRPAMYATTKTFLDYFNLKNLDELPALSEIRDLDKINAELDLNGAGDPATLLPDAQQELEAEGIAQEDLDEMLMQESDEALDTEAGCTQKHH
jgi:segregation and condensation protein B